jgi:hypothetical protein
MVGVMGRADDKRSRGGVVHEGWLEFAVAWTKLAQEAEAKQRQ